MKRILCSLLVASPADRRVLAQIRRRQKNAKGTLVYQHEPPNVPARASRACSSSMGGWYSPGHTRPDQPSSTRPFSRGRSVARSTKDRRRCRGRREFSELPGDVRRQHECKSTSMGSGRPLC